MLSGWEIDGLIMICTPLVYLYDVGSRYHKSLVFLVIPILVNIALWIPSYVTYIFLRAVLCLEFIKLIVITVASMPLILFLTVVVSDNPNGSGLLPLVFFLISILLLSILFYINMKIRSILKQDDIKIYFHVNGKTEQDICLHLRPLVVFFGVLFVANAIYKNFM